MNQNSFITNKFCNKICNITFKYSNELKKNIIKL